jgi:hypothetical protein
MNFREFIFYAKFVNKGKKKDRGCSSYHVPRPFPYWTPLAAVVNVQREGRGLAACVVEVQEPTATDTGLSSANRRCLRVANSQERSSAKTLARRHSLTVEYLLRAGHAMHHHLGETFLPSRKTRGGCIC